MVNNLEKFMSKINKTNYCWEWSKSVDSWGYGLFWINGKLSKAHRYSYEQFIGPIPEGMIVMHSCDNPRCVNPDHLSIGTHADNSDDRNKKLRLFRKLSKEDVISIRKDPRIHKLIAEDYGVNKSQISRIKSGKTWSHINNDV